MLPPDRPADSVPELSHTANRRPHHPVSVSGVAAFVVVVLGLSSLQGLMPTWGDDGTGQAVAAGLLTVLGGGLSPALAMLVVATLTISWASTRALLRDTIRLPRTPLLYILPVSIPVVAAVVAMTVTGTSDVSGHTDAPTAVAFVAQILVVGPLFAYAENLGWRTWLQRGLQRWIGAATSGVIVGVVWAAWHLPLFVFDLSDMHAQLPFAPYAAGLVALSMMLALVYDRSAGSLLPVVAGHLTYNLAVGLALTRTDSPTKLLLAVAATLLVATTLLHTRVLRSVALEV